MSTSVNTVPILSRFPQFELSYETISHKKVSDPYNVALAIPMGKKYYIWFTFDGKQNVCYLMEITRDKRIGKIVSLATTFHHSMSLGTVLYGTVVSLETDKHTPAEHPNTVARVFLDERTHLDNSQRTGRSQPTSHSVPKREEPCNAFIIEDIFYYKGISIKHHTFSEKLGALDNMFSERFITHNNTMVFVLPVMWTTNILDDIRNKHIIDNCGYTVHHIQYRSLVQIVPYINMSAKPKTTMVEQSPSMQLPDTTFYGIIPQINYTKPQYKYPTTFVIRADIQFDIYHLFAYGLNKSQVYCGLACIPNYEKSIFMNGLFRNIRENRNLDYIEESDDEEDFEDTRLDKYVDSEKILLMECVFHKKFKKWVPVRIAPNGQQVVHIHKL